MFVVRGLGVVAVGQSSMQRCYAIAIAIIDLADHCNPSIRRPITRRWPTEHRQDHQRRPFGQSHRHNFVASDRSFLRARHPVRSNFRRPPPGQKPVCIRLLDSRHGTPAREGEGHHRPPNPADPSVCAPWLPVCNKNGKLQISFGRRRGDSEQMEVSRATL